MQSLIKELAWVQSLIKELAWVQSLIKMSWSWLGCKVRLNIKAQNVESFKVVNIFKH